MESFRACYWYVKIPQCGYIEHGLEYIMFYVKKRIAHLAVCFGLPLINDKPLIASAFVRLAYSVFHSLGDNIYICNVIHIIW